MALMLMVVAGLMWKLGLPTCICGVAITAGIAMRARVNPLRIARGVSWSVIPLVAGLFFV